MSCCCTTISTAFCSVGVVVSVAGSGGVPGGGWAQFVPGTAQAYGLDPKDRTNPVLTIAAEARMMADMMKRYGGNWNSRSDIDAVLSGYYGTGPASFNSAYNNYSAAYLAGGGAGSFVGRSQQPVVNIGFIVVEVSMPDGSKVQATGKVKYNGVAGVHVQRNHTHLAHHANKGYVRR